MYKDSLFEQTDGTLTMDYGEAQVAPYGAPGEEPVWRMTGGTAQLDALRIGWRDPLNAATPPYGTGHVEHLGGDMALNSLSLLSGSYLHTGGSLTVHDYLRVQDTFDFGGSSQTVNLGTTATLDLRGATFTGGALATITGNDQGLVFVDAGVDPATLGVNLQTGATVIEDGQALTIEAHQHVLLAGTWTGDLIVRGVMSRPTDQAFTPQGNVTVDGGTLDLGYALWEIDGDTVQVLGGTIRSARLTRIGVTQHSQVDVAGGVVDLNNSFSLGWSADARLNLSGGEFDAQGLTMGRGGDAHVEHTGGVMRATPSLGQTAAHAATYRLSGTGRIESGGLIVGQFNQAGSGTTMATFTQDGGVVDSFGTVILGNNADTHGDYIMNAGVLETANNLQVGYRGTGTFEQNGGAVMVAGEVTSGGSGSVNGTGTYTIRGGTLSASEISVTNFNQEGGTVTTGDFFSALNMTGGELTANNVLSGLLVGNAFIDGGVLNINEFFSSYYGYVVTGNNGAHMNFADGTIGRFDTATFLSLGDMHMTAGTNSLLMFAAGFDPYAEFATFETDGLVHFVGNTVELPEGFVLETEQAIQDDLINRGLIRPGSSPGTLALGGDFTQAAEGSLEIELQGAAAAARDLLTAQGDITLGGSLELVLLGSEGDPTQPAITAGTYVIVETIGGTLSGAFDSITDLGVYDDAVGVEIDTVSGEVRLTIDQDIVVGDLNLDAVIDIDDLEVLAGKWTQAADRLTEGDINGDGVVDARDLDLLRLQWGTGVEGPVQGLSEALAAVTFVPEPGSAAVLGLAGFVVLARSGRRRAR